MLKVDINCDMGEGFGLYDFGYDEEIMSFITSANIACGFHAGDPHKIRNTVRLAKKYNVQIGAHPGFPDLLGFGRRHLDCSPSEIKDYVTYQLGALSAFAKVEQIQIQHCKPHGALYMQAMEDEVIARAFLEVISELNKDIIVFALHDSAMEYTGRKMGIRIAEEVYADCEHTKSGGIVPLRYSTEINDVNSQVNRVIRMVKEGVVKVDTGEEISIKAQTICVHGDTRNAVNLIKTIQKELLNNQIEITAIQNIV